MNNKIIRGEILLIITAIIWGTSFVVQRVGMELIGPFTFTATRFLVGTLSLIPIILITDKVNKKEEENKTENKTEAETGIRKELLIGGIACGLALFSGISFQQAGLQYTTAGKAGFITA